MRTADTNTNVQLSFKERLGYGLGDYAGNLSYSAMTAFLLVYYTNVVGASAAVAASIIAVSKLFDGITDLAMGHIVDHTKSKWGKARPWIARLAVPLAVSTVLMFSVPAGLSDRVQMVYMFLTYNLVSTIFFTGINVPYATMNGLMTTNQYERGLLGNFRMLLATAGTMTINTLVLKMTSFFGGGDPYSQFGWTMTFIILMVAFTAITFFTFYTCKERVVQEVKEGTSTSVKDFASGLKDLVVNKYWVLLVLNGFTMYLMMATFFGSGVYYAQYVMGDAGLFAPIANTLSIAQIGTMFLTPFIMKKLSKRQLALMGAVISGFGFALNGLSHEPAFVIFTSVLKGIGFGCGAATMFGMLQDAITYGEWLTGRGAAGMGNAASSFTTKIGSGVGTAVLGWVLSIGGFNAANAIQTEGAVSAIAASFVWIPFVATIINFTCLALFDLDKHYDHAVSELEAGRYKASA
ncbi:MAG: glycoside-pentoside-hexuronide (GPH):cation symporter [Spirochaetales bacterium]|nr:glycoside-pentoside-hexuronide (GPH):cation symporter [Spirochaetales bacterium]